MFFGSYFSGSAPLLFSMSEEKLQRVSVLGAGLLVGTALAIIIPEGVQTLLKSYTQTAASAMASVPAASTTAEGGDAGGGDEGVSSPGGHQRGYGHHQHGEGVHAHGGGDMEGLDMAIGVSLVLGFLFMMLIDQLASSRCDSFKSRFFCSYNVLMPFAARPSPTWNRPLPPAPLRPP